MDKLKWYFPSSLRTSGWSYKSQGCTARPNGMESGPHITQPLHHHTDLNQLKGVYNQINNTSKNLVFIRIRHLRPIFRGLPLKRHGQTMLASSISEDAANFDASYNLAALAGPTTENEPVPSSSTSGAGASTSADPRDVDADLRDVGMGMADGMDTADNFSWEIPLHHVPILVASTSVMAAPPISSSGNSGKCSHHNMVFDTTPPSVTSYTLMSETAMSGVPRAYSDVP
ncbi:hypothetical protein DEU56DRAFT_759711 [Suillus clintonianus]|uniref:uncharacterized protein n=1 Tax=Suillus clintonianus TaxID=1904413 RepID=UPI001B867285|nr:uncharacterized protein DEU56DRAFT_759711 [Suillus clintonianus]KAG2124351.1 hypothetical protein DEU56DRAFT_759711 [Suillus clintonianus]